MTALRRVKPDDLDPDFAEAKSICNGRGNWLTAVALADDLKFARGAVDSVRDGKHPHPENVVRLLEALMLARGLQLVPAQEFYIKLINETRALIASQTTTEASIVYRDEDEAGELPNKIGSIYVIESGEFVKIGFSSKPESRVAQLQTSTPHKLKILYIRAGSARLERELHQRFAGQRHSGEWFTRDGDLATWIDAGCPI